MSDTKANELLETADQAETEALWNRWRKGELTHYAAQLLEFVELEREAILCRASNSGEAETVIRAVKSVVVERGTVHRQAEIHDQMREIHDYIWYAGERDDHDRDRIALDWARLHAGNWRRWRMKEYLFVIDRKAAEIVDRIRGARNAPSRDKNETNKQIR